jgi:hypothetical protein
MAVTRPNVVVYQEFASLSIVANSPAMEVLVVGPCYQLLDYLDDKTECNTEQEYGALDGMNPVSPAASVLISSPPNLREPGVLSADSVRVFIDGARVQIHGIVVGDTSYLATYTAGDNLFEAYAVAGDVDFVTKGVAPGDILNTNTGATTNITSVVSSVRSTINDTTGHTLDFLSGNITYGKILAGYTVIITEDTHAGTKRNGTYTVANVRSNTILEIENAINSEGEAWVSHTVNGLSGATLSLQFLDNDGVAVTGYSPAVQTLAITNETCLRMADDFTLTNSATAAERVWRIEREVDDIELSASQITVDENTVEVDAAITVDLSSTLTGKTLTYGNIYMEYAALRQDMQMPISYGSYAEMAADLGKYDARNPLMVGATVAKANTSTSVKVFGISEDTLAGYLDFIDKISSERYIYAIVPLTTNPSVLATIDQNNRNLSDPTYVLANGIRQKFRVCIGSVEKFAMKNITGVSGGATTATVDAGAPTTNHTLKIALGGGLTGVTFTGTGDLCVLPGDTLRLTEATGPVVTNFTVAHVIDATHVEVDPAGAVVPTGPTTFAVGDSLTVIKKGTSTNRFTITLAGTETITVTPDPTPSAKLYLSLVDSTATFVTDGVIPGDYIYMPVNPNADPNPGTDGDWTTYDTFVVATRESQTRLTIVNHGKNTPTTANELPHNIPRIGGAAVSQGNMFYKVVRSMTKDQQVTDMVAAATSYSSKRMLLCYPDSVRVADLKDASLTRVNPTTPVAAAMQPGYYLSCAVGGQTAGNPTQQGFTNMAISGISTVSGSTGYFTEKQLTDLSNGGVYVFIQDTPTTLPYSIHEVTTDVSALEFGEYMVTKNFDYISVTFLDVLIPFIGRWNVLPSTIEYIKSALKGSGETLKKQFVAKIGAPLNSYNIDSVAVSDVSTDRIEAYVTVDIPMTLNTIGLHLVA